MTKKALVLLTSLLLLINNKIYSQMAELPLSQKLQQASDIFEGKVIHKSCFWNEQHNLIYTSNTIEVYKVFKGNISSLEVEIITEGGQIDNEMQGSDSNLELNEGAIGVFFAEVFKIPNSKNSKNSRLSYRVYGSAQGFIKFDLASNSASDAFNKYKNIQNDVYKAIEKYTDHPYKEIKAFTTSQPKKCSFWVRKKKNKK